ncbi:MAPEG family protein [Brevundimonas sp.]|uniref:MAPEG family protein n=1 Tax=Brevundimonas sp. TaxID=1871086 RepID=UPI002FC6D154
MTAMTALQAVALWSGLLILLLIGLSLRTIFTRKRLKVSLGDGPNSEMTVISRAFGNAAEYIPPLLIILLLMALLGFQPVWIHLLGGAMFLGRLLHAWGLGKKIQPSFGRVSGMILTQLTLAGGALALIACAFGCI